MLHIINNYDWLVTYAPQLLATIAILLGALVTEQFIKILIQAKRDAQKKFENTL